MDPSFWIDQRGSLISDRRFGSVVSDRPTWIGRLRPTDLTWIGHRGSDPTNFDRVGVVSARAGRFATGAAQTKVFAHACIATPLKNGVYKTGNGSILG